MMINSPWAWSNLDKGGIKTWRSPAADPERQASQGLRWRTGCHHQRRQPEQDLAIPVPRELPADRAGLAPMNADKPLGAVA